ncbi:sentrin-specific protease 1-like [Chelonus insularis]|uniref:sentrin-specific protease 1-like n=1 Tax=Chelonus insularis TaxID=460826 RepID=UPI001589C289|nr:sentrin-specific protease 1-like [Chelonus insularis]
MWSKCCKKVETEILRIALNNWIIPKFIEEVNSRNKKIKEEESVDTDDDDEDEWEDVPDEETKSQDVHEMDVVPELREMEIASQETPKLEKQSSAMDEPCSPPLPRSHKRKLILLANAIADELYSISTSPLDDYKIINVYLEMIAERGAPSIYACNTFFFQQLMLRGYEGVQSWTRKVRLFSKEIDDDSHSSRCSLVFDSD